MLMLANELVIGTVSFTFCLSLLWFWLDRDDDPRVAVFKCSALWDCWGSCSHTERSLNHWPCFRPESREKGSRWRGSVCERNVIENHWKNNETPLSLSPSLSRSIPLKHAHTTDPITWSELRRCVKAQTRTDTQNTACLPHKAHLQLHADRSWWVLASLLLRRTVRMIARCSPASIGERKARKWQSISGNESHDADTQPQYTERVGQGQVVASSLTCCQVLEHREQNYPTLSNIPAVFTLCMQVKRSLIIHYLASTPPLSLHNTYTHPPTHSLP